MNLFRQQVAKDFGNVIHDGDSPVVLHADGTQDPEGSQGSVTEAVGGCHQGKGGEVRAAVFL